MGNAARRIKASVLAHMLLFMLPGVKMLAVFGMPMLHQFCLPDFKTRSWS